MGSQSAKRVCVVGAAGRMGRRVVRLLSERDDLVLSGALDKGGKQSVGVDAGVLAGVASAGVTVTDDTRVALAGADVVIDFSAPAAAAELAPLCAEQGVSYVLASTGLSDGDASAVAEASEKVAVLQAANLSTGVNMMLELVELAAKRLKGFDVEVFEIHHKHKRDAPSGTALALGESVEQGRGSMKTVLSRQGLSEPRDERELGYGALRGGDVAGEHTVFYFGQGERIEITHRSTTGDIFAAGALKAAAWLAGRKPGQYTMRDVIVG